MSRAPAEIVQDFVDLLSGKVMQVGDGHTVRFDHGVMHPEITAEGQNIRLKFPEDEKPLCGIKKVIKFEIHGLLVKPDGIQVDLEFTTRRCDPSFTWEELKK